MNPSNSLSLDLRVAQRASNLAAFPWRTANLLVATYRSLFSRPFVVKFSSSVSIVAKSGLVLAIPGYEVVNAEAPCARQRALKTLVNDTIDSVVVRS